MASKTFSQKLMSVSLDTILGRFRKHGLLPKAAGDALLERIPVIGLSEIVRRPMVRIEGSFSYRDGYLPLCDLLALLSILVSRSPKTVVEIGTFNGYTTRMMALNLPSADIHTIDLPEKFAESDSGMRKDDWHLISTRRVGCEYFADPSITSITQHFGDTAEYHFPAAEFFFIDGAHIYDYARNDTEKALSCPGAQWLLWHDCDRLHPDVTRWLFEMIQKGYPVRRIGGTNLAFLELQTVGAPQVLA